MTIDERKQINDKISQLIGSYEDNRKYIENLDISQRIKESKKYSTLREKLFKMAEKQGLKALQLTLIDEGNVKRGITPNGKKVVWYGNNGMTERSRYCGTLVIDGETIFTSGTVAKVFEYLLNN